LGGGGEVKVRPALKADKFIVMSELIVYKMWDVHHFLWMAFAFAVMKFLPRNSISEATGKTHVLQVEFSKYPCPSDTVLSTRQLSTLRGNYDITRNSQETEVTSSFIVL
jgi:hypothetical protein